MDLQAQISIAESIVVMATAITPFLQQASKKESIASKRTLLYLKVAQSSIRALGQERQNILTDAKTCNINNPEQVALLYKKLHIYLFEDNIRPLLKESISGLGECIEKVEDEAQSILWRDQNRDAAIASFANTIVTLIDTLRSLQDNFLPGGSGMGVLTLSPIYDLLEKVKNAQEIQTENSSFELKSLVLSAYQDPSHLYWFEITAEIEALVAKLQLAFSIQDQ